MLLSEICVKRPVFATVLSLILLAVGAIFFTKLQVRDLPDIDFPIINVNCNYYGADAQYMERNITTRLEKELRTIKNVDSITSQSSAGSSNITINFKLAANIETALNDVRSKISDISYIFPEGMRMPSISKINMDQHPSLWITLNSDKFTNSELTKLVTSFVKTPLEKLESVANVRMHGGYDYVMRIEPIPLKMFQYKISPLDIETAIKEQNKNYPAGTIKTINKDFILSLNTYLTKPKDFGNIILKNENSHILKLKDVANVYLGTGEENVIFRYNGNRTIALGLVKQSKSNIIEMSKDVRKEVEKIRKMLPPNVVLEIPFDKAVSVNASINGVFKTIIESLILVVLITYIFLGSVRVTIIPAVTIPLSLISTFSVMYWFGFSINTFTLLAIVLAIGLVVDDAIVMLENIFRHCEHGETAMQATIKAIKEISFAIIAMTLTLAAVFLPVGFVEGFVGKLFIEFAWTLAFCVLFSGFIALTLTPMMASRMLTVNTKPSFVFLIKIESWLKLIQLKYSEYLSYTLDNKKKFLLLSSISILILILSFIFVNKTFMPNEDNGYIQVMYNGPIGSNVEHSEQTVIATEQIMNNYKDILGSFSIIGWPNSNGAFAYITLKDWSNRTKSSTEIVTDLNKKFYSFPEMSIFAINPNFFGGKEGSAVEFNLQSFLEYSDLDKLSETFVNELNKNQIFTNVKRDYDSTTPSLNILVNKDKAYFYGVDVKSIGYTMQYLLAGKQVGDFQLGNEIYDVILRYNKNERSNIYDVRNIFIKNNKNILLPLEVVAKINETNTVNSYKHYNNSKAITISADLNNSYKITDAIKAINKLAENLIDKSTTKLEYLGQIKDMQESSGKIFITFLFALVFIYLVLSAQFESFLDSILILISVPFSITGGVLALLLFGNTLNVYSNIGLVTLIGLITKNAIMVVEFANQLLNQGVNAREAISKASSLRLRPILMTTMSTICGSLPLIFTVGPGSAARSSIGLVIVGGMLVGSAFTLFVIPVLYQILKDRRQNSVNSMIS